MNCVFKTHDWFYVDSIRVISLFSLAPAVFTMVWAVVRPMLTARSLSKIHIFGTKREQWRKKLLQYIDPENLPASYGGLNTTNMASSMRNLSTMFDCTNY